MNSTNAESRFWADDFPSASGCDMALHMQVKPSTAQIPVEERGSKLKSLSISSIFGNKSIFESDPA
jgi:hypothetical protein